jgi:hypothetical protein
LFSEAPSASRWVLIFTITAGQHCDSVAQVKENQQDLLQIPVINENPVGLEKFP